ncbi:hypothetical protein EIP86_010048 [Pleurotus ostreatoroseus]|nr:hypothetical protein EIP86_010048 [Pleurotus ostreatoroseus]
MYLNFTAEATADILIAVSLSVTLMTRKTGIIPFDEADDLCRWHGGINMKWIRQLAIMFI